MKKIIVLLVSMLCVSSAVYAAASEEGSGSGDGGRKKSRRHKKRTEVVAVSGGAPTVASFIVGTLCNDMGASHRVEWITPNGASYFVPAGQAVKIDEEIPFDTTFDPDHVTLDTVSASQRFVKGDHSYLIKHYKEGIWAFRVKDRGVAAKSDRKKLASLVVGGDNQVLDLAFVHPDATEKKKTAALITLALGEHAKALRAKGSAGKRGSLTSIVRRGRSLSSTSAAASSSKK